jgi:hypothetical protein
MAPVGIAVVVDNVFSDCEGTAKCVCVHERIS